MQKTKDRDWTWSICNIPFQWSCFSQKHLDPIVWQTSVKTTMDYGSILESSELKLMFDSETNIPARKELIFLTQSKKKNCFISWHLFYFQHKYWAWITAQKAADFKMFWEFFFIFSFQYIRVEYQQCIASRVERCLVVVVTAAELSRLCCHGLVAPWCLMHAFLYWRK